MPETDTPRKGCLHADGHDFADLTNLTAENQKRLGRGDIVSWSACRFCGAVLEVLAGNGEPPRITLPLYFYGQGNRIDD